MAIDLSGYEITKFDVLYDVYLLYGETESIMYRYTSSKESISVGGYTYVPAPIEKKAIQKDGEIENTSVTIRIPVTLSFVSYVASAPPSCFRVDIWLYQNGAKQYRVLAGNVTSIKVNQDYIAEISMVEEILQTKLPINFIEPGCNHSLFSTACGLNRADYIEDVTVAAITEDIAIESADLAGFDSLYFEGGTAVFGSESRYITSSVGGSPWGTIYIQAPFSSLSVSDEIIVLPGCNKLSSTCKDKFDNFDNFLGFTAVPKKNPVLSGI